MNTAQNSRRGIVLAMVGLYVTQTCARAEPIDIEFTGIVNKATGGFSSVPVGSNVMGNLTIDFDKSRNPDCDTPPISGPWICGLSGGSFTGEPPIAERMLEFVVSVNGITYQTSDYPPSDFYDVHKVEANIEDVNNVNHNRWHAIALQVNEPAPTDDSNESRLTFLNPNELPYTNTGYPVVSGATTGTGLFCARTAGPGTSGCVVYDITSLTPLDAIPVYTPPPNGGGGGGGGGGSGAVGLWSGLALLGFAFLRASRRRESRYCTSVYGLLLIASNLLMTHMARLRTYIRPLKSAYVDAGP